MSEETVKAEPAESAQQRVEKALNDFRMAVPDEVTNAVIVVAYDSDEASQLKMEVRSFGSRLGNLGLLVVATNQITNQGVSKTQVNELDAQTQNEGNPNAAA